MLEKTLEGPLESKEINRVNPKGHQPWIFTGRTSAETEAPIIWPPDVKSRLTGKNPDSGKDRRQEEKGQQMVVWHHWLDGHEFEQTLGDTGGQKSLACCSSWGHRVGRKLATEQQNATLPPLQEQWQERGWWHDADNDIVTVTEWLLLL